MGNGQVNKVPLDADLKLTVLGGASLSYVLPNQQVTQVLGAGKPLALLVYLARLPSRMATRDHVLDLLWADQEPALAKPALRQAIWYLRKRIGDTSIETGEGVIKLALQLESDADRFEFSVGSGELEPAVGLYGGPFLPELAVPGGAEFEHWANGERARLEALFFRTSEVVIRNCLSEGRFADAEALARRARDMNRVRQEGWRLLLEALTAAGDAVRASVEAEELERYVAEVGSRLNNATAEAVRLARQIPADSSEVSSGRAMVADLIGRERDFALILRVWEEVKNGKGSHLTVNARAGLGKTRLLTDVHMRLHASGTQVVHVRANVGEQQIEYSLAAGIAAALSKLPGAKGISPRCAASLVALNPVLADTYIVPAVSAGGSDALRTRTIALTELLSAVADEQPVAVLVDDVHWADNASKHVLGGLAGGIARKPAMLITASRPTTRSPVQDSAQEEITLHPLTMEHVIALVSSLGSLPTEDWVRDALSLLHDVTGGSPLLTLETLQLEIDRGTLELSDGAWSCNDPATLQTEIEQGGALRHRVSKLARSESWYLLLLAVAGTPVSALQLARMTGGSEDSLLEATQPLEQRGFLSRIGNELQLAHDEIGSLAVELASGEALEAARGAVGRTLAEEAGGDEHLLVRAGQLLASSKEVGWLNDVFRRRLRIARQRGDRRRASELARDLLGGNFSADKSAMMMRSLPPHYRIGLTTPRRISTAAFAVLTLLLVTAAAVLWPAGDPPAIGVVAYDRTTGPFGNPLGAWFGRNDVVARQSIELRTTDRAPRIDSVHAQPVPSPVGGRWAFSKLTPDSGEIDVFIVDADGNQQRITHTPNDDGVQDWSPDGKYLLIVSSRWHPAERYEAATVEVATGNVVRLTHSSQNESSLKWSPDGTRIGYTRTEPGADETEFCWTTPRADPPTCIHITGRFAGWRGPNHVYLSSDSVGTAWFGVLDLEYGRFEPLFPADQYNRFHTSRNGDWFLGLYHDSLGGTLAWHVFPVDAPETATDVLLPSGNNEGYVLALHSSQREYHFLDSLEIDHRGDSFPVGVPLLLHSAGYDATRERMPVPTIEWSGNDQSIASVDREGIILGLQAGSVTLRAVAGGWREDIATISFIDAEKEDTFSEAWAGNWTERWAPYGDPAPVVTVGPDSVRAFWNNADASFTSGAYSRQEWSARDGLGVRVAVSNDITTPGDQTLSLAFAGWMDPVALDEWNHKDDYVPGRSNDSRPEHCAIAYPNRNSVLDGDVALQVGRGMFSAQSGRAVHTGEWHSVTVQIFPDGTCGVAVDGRAIARSTARVPLDPMYRLWTEGRSNGSEMLVGPLQLWIGVDTDIEWGDLDWPE